jgi:hypothetical protein
VKERGFYRCFSADRVYLARNMSAKLRAAAGLTRMLQARTDRAAARDLLAPVYNWFTEGFDTADQKDAKAVLDEQGNRRSSTS